MICNNISRCHDAYVIDEGDSGMRVICKECKATEVIRMDSQRGVPYNRQYIKFFKRLTLQGNNKLLYKYYSQHLRT